MFAEYDIKQVACHSEWFSLLLIPMLGTQASDFRPLLLKNLICSCRERKVKGVLPLYMEYSVLRS